MSPTGSSRAVAPGAGSRPGPWWRRPSWWIPARRWPCARSAPSSSHPSWSAGCTWSSRSCAVGRRRTPSRCGAATRTGPARPRRRRPGCPRTGDAMPDGPRWLAVAPPPELAAGPEAVPEAPMGPPLAPELHRAPGDAPDLRDPLLGSGHRRDAWLGTSARPRCAGRCLARDRPRGRLVGVGDGTPGPTPSGRDGRLHPRLPQRPLVPSARREGRLEPLFHRGHSVAAREGFTVEVRELWTRTGQLVSWNTQTVAVIK